MHSPQSFSKTRTGRCRKEAAIRLRHVLKALLRRYDLRCIKAVEVSPAEGSGDVHQDLEDVE